MNEEDVKKITEYIFLKSNPQKADLALVFGTWHEEPIIKVFELYKYGFISKILVSGGKNRVMGGNEALEMSKKLVTLGVNKSDIILEDQSTNSLENVLFSKEVINNIFGLDNIKKILPLLSITIQEEL